MDIVKIGWSGGKDSTCSVCLHLEQDDLVKIVCYVPMFTDNIPLLTKRHFEFINNTADIFINQGASVFFVKGITYYDYVLHRSTRGKHKGKIFGFPYFNTGKCGFKRDSKEKACNNVDVGYYDYLSLGIAYDEFNRHFQLNENKRSILVEKQYTEQMCKKYCYNRSLLSPHYEYSSRDGCVLCPNAKDIERSIWFSDYPDAKRLLIELQNFVMIEKPDCYPLRNYRWFIDPYQLSFFD